jgi:hypothetical protein
VKFLLDLLFEAGDANHEKIVEIGREDCKELQAFEYRVLMVESLLQNACMKLQEAQLTVKENIGFIAVERHVRRVSGIDERPLP